MADFTPEEFVRCIDFRYITDAITPEEAVEMLKGMEGSKGERIQHALESKAVPAYTTSAGWLGYGEDKMKDLLKETLGQGYKHFKLKVGGNVEEDRRRLSIAREVIGYDQGNILMVDANQVRLKPLSSTLRNDDTDQRKGLVRSRGNRIYGPSQGVQAMVHRRTYLPRRHPRPQSHPRRPQTSWHWCCNRRDVPESRYLQATLVNWSHRRVPN